LNPSKDTMNDDTLTPDFRALAVACMRLAGEILKAQTPQAKNNIEGATAGGGRLFVEFGPLPDFEAVRLVLVEREGRRHELGSIQIKAGPVWR